MPQQQIIISYMVFYVTVKVVIYRKMVETRKKQRKYKQRMYQRKLTELSVICTHIHSHITHRIPLHLCLRGLYASYQRRVLGFHYGPLFVPSSRCPDISTVVLCQHGLIRRAGESITHTRLRRHYTLRMVLALFSLSLNYNKLNKSFDFLTFNQLHTQEKNNLKALIVSIWFVLNSFIKKLIYFQLPDLSSTRPT